MYSTALAPAKSKQPPFTAWSWTPPGVSTVPGVKPGGDAIGQVTWLLGMLFGSTRQPQLAWSSPLSPGSWSGRPEPAGGARRSGGGRFGLHGPLHRVAWMLIVSWSRFSTTAWRLQLGPNGQPARSSFVSTYGFETCAM